MTIRVNVPAIVKAVKSEIKVIRVMFVFFIPSLYCK